MSTYTAWSVTFGEQPSAAKWNILGTNMAYFYELLNGTNGIDGWTALGIGASSAVYNGNRSYTLTMASTVAAVLTPQTKLKITNTVSAPTQCTSLNGTTQYWVKTTPNKLTFTDDFVISAWIKVSAYLGTNQTIVSRWNGTSGWRLIVNTAGQIILQAFNGGSGNNSYVQSYQSVPVNKWVHIAVQLDMSSFTASTTTSYVMIDGADVPAAVIRGGTNPTALVQAGNLEIGSGNGGTEFFGGKIAQVAIFNAKVTQSTIRGYISQGLSGTETSIASAYSFNNSTSDLNTTTPNDLSAGAGAPTATNADSPFAQNSNLTATGTTNYAIVDSVSTTTVVVKVPEGCTIPTSGGISSVNYSVSGVPYGFPTDKVRWEITYIGKFQMIKSAPTGGTYYSGASSNGEWMFTLPVGSYNLTFEFNVSSINSTQVAAPQVALSTSNSSVSDLELFARMAAPVTGAGSFDTFVTRGKPIVVTSSTPLYLLVCSVTASATQVSINGNISATVIRAIPSGI